MLTCCGAPAANADPAAASDLARAEPVDDAGDRRYGCRMSTSLRRFLTIALWEGISYLVLLAVCMPLKYGAGIAWPVRLMGSVHGGLFIAYGLALAAVLKHVGLRWAVVAMAVSFVPGGTFWLDRRWRRTFGGAAAAARPTS